MGFAPEGGEKGKPSPILANPRPQAAINRNFISVVSTALPLSTHHFPATERCLAEGDSTSAEKQDVMAEAICQAGLD